MSITESDNNLNFSVGVDFGGEVSSCPTSHLDTGFGRGFGGMLAHPHVSGSVQ